MHKMREVKVGRSEGLEIKRTDALLERAVQMGLADEAERLHEKLCKLTERV